MKTEVKKLDGTKKEITIELKGDAVKNKFEEVFQKISQEAKIPGFRTGHAPRDMIEKNFSQRAHQLVLEELIPDTYSQAIKEVGLDVIDLPSISEVKLERESLFFKATVETTPEITLGNYKGLRVNYKKIEVTPDEVKRNIDALKETRKLGALDDSFARGLGYPNLAQLEKALEGQIFLQKENQERQKIESEIVEKIIQDADFKLPASLVSRQLQDLVRQAKLDLVLKGFPREKIEEQEKELSEKLGPEAKKQVKVYLVMSAIAKKENIAIDDHMPGRVMEFLLKEADWKESS